jgi:hypothetical protein
MIGIALYNRMKRKYEDQFLTTQILNDKIKKKLILKNDKKKDQNQLVLTFKTRDLGYKLRINLIEGKP